jgi:hypothetical protein
LLALREWLIALRLEEYALIGVDVLARLTMRV